MNRRVTIDKELCIIILNYNNDSDTIACVTSVYKSENIDLPFIIIVNNSDNESKLDNGIEFYPDIEVLTPEKNLGFAEGNNYGIRWALNNLTFNFLLVLNNDTILKKDTLSKMLAYTHKNPSVTVVAPCIITAEEPPRIWYAGGKLNNVNMTPIIDHIEENFSVSDLKDSYTEFASGCAFIISKKMYDFSKDLFDPYFFIYDEDVELSMRLLKQGKIIAFIREAIVIHKCQGSQQPGIQKRINQLSPSGKNLLFYLKHTIRNRYYIICKHFKGFDRFGKMFRITLYWLMKSVQFAMHFKFKAATLVIVEIMRFSFNKTKLH